MRHGIAEGRPPLSDEPGTTLTVLTGARRDRPEGVIVAEGQEEIRIGYTFENDPQTNECHLRFTCRFPASANREEDWDKAAKAEMVLREVLGGIDPFRFVFTSGGDDAADDE